MSLDHFDIEILAILQEGNLIPQRSIGEKVNLSAAAVNRRVKRMEADGVIRANIAVLDAEKVGQRITIIVEVELESEHADLVDQAKAAFLATPEVQQCYYVTGEMDFVLVVSVASMGDYELLTRRLFFDNPNMKRFRTLVAMNCVKVGLSIPLQTSVK